MAMTPDRRALRWRRRRPRCSAPRPSVPAPAFPRSHSRFHGNALEASERATTPSVKPSFKWQNSSDALQLERKSNRPTLSALLPHPRLSLWAFWNIPETGPKSHHPHLVEGATMDGLPNAPQGSQGGMVHSCYC